MSAWDRKILDKIEKLPWYGVDPIKSRDTMELIKYLNPRKFDLDSDKCLEALLAAVDKLEAIRNARS